LFDWEGGVDEIATIDSEINRVAKVGNITLSILAQSIIVMIKRNGKFTVNEEFEMTAVIWLLISTSTSDPDHPGCFRDYLQAWDFDFDIELDPDDETFEIEMTGSHSAAGTA
jgi:hypothetical protein